MDLVASWSVVRYLAASILVFAVFASCSKSPGSEDGSDPTTDLTKQDQDDGVAPGSSTSLADAPMLAVLPSVPEQCAVTPFAKEPPPAERGFTPTWYRNSEATLAAGLDRSSLGKWYEGTGHKVGWLMPRGRLRIEGRQLEGAAEPFVIEDEDIFGPGFHPSAFALPGEGCWEIRGSVATADLRFVVFAFPERYRPSNRRSGETLAEQARNADVVVRAHVAEPLSQSGFLLYPLRVVRAWTELGVDVGSAVNVLMPELPALPEWWEGEDGFGAQNLEPGHEYLLFLEARADGMFYVVVGHDGWIGQIVDGRVSPLASWPAWEGTSIADVEEDLSEHFDG